MMRVALEAFRQQRWAQAVPGLAQAVLQRPDPNVQTLLGIALLNLGELDAAASHLDQVLSRQPDQLDARFHLGLIAQARGELEVAEASMRVVLQRRPGHIPARLQLARCLSARQAVPEAVAAWRAVLDGLPDEPEPWLGLAMGLATLGHREAAIQSAQQAARLAPEDREVCARLGLLLVEDGQLDEAVPWLQRAGRHPDAMAGLVLVLMRRGEHEAAAQVTEGVSPQEMPPPLLEAWATLAARRGQAAQACQAVGRSLKQEHTRADRVLLLHTRASLHDRLGQHAAAFADWSAANQLRPADYSPARNAAETDALIAAHPIPIQVAPQGRLPAILIVGMPRSGTSLLEQMLDTHPGLTGAGELRALHDALQASADLTVAGQQYLSALASHGGGTGVVVVDKMPHNFRNLGAVVQMVPGIKVLHMVRDPLDVCFSCYRQRFQDGMAYTTRLEWLASFYTDYARLMAHWRRVLPPGAMLDVSYRSLVSRPAETLRAVCGFLGVPFDARVLSPESNRRGVATASRDEVTEPIHTRSLGRASAYRLHLGKLVSSLSGEVWPR